ncbi:unnamed protein product [Allacma fusca]|uniref:Exonuclease domain-containing protein n=1 Tax=Allacma fusca TaxID=39272 RepID=A0A8J2KV54_9HEXA|nr:unnamed protein product [Allacma fusca]
MDNAEEEVINWAAVKTFDEKKVFLKAYFDALSPEEMKWARNIAQRYKRGHDKRKKENKTGVKTTVQEVKKSNVQTPENSSVQPLLYTSPSGETVEGWWSKFEKSEVVSLDCEMVAVKKSGKYVQEAALVSVCNYNGKEIYKATVKHAKDSFKVDKYTLAINGIKSDSLIDGRELEDVRTDLEELFDQKLILGCAVAGDFKCLGMESGDYDIFDVQWEWYWLDNDGSRKPFKLKALYKHFFPTEAFQDGIHDPFVDAKAVMKIFRFKYLMGEKKDAFASRLNPQAVPDGDIDRLLVPKVQKNVLSKNSFRIG